MQIPAIKSPEIFPLPDIQNFILDNGLQVYYIEDKKVNGIKIEMNFAAGRIAEARHSVSELCCELFKESAAGQSGYDNSLYFESRGSSLYTYNGMDYCGIGFFALSGFATELFNRFIEIVTKPAFRVDELEKVQKRKLEKLNEVLAENDSLSYRSLTARVFGRNHPYGYNSTVHSIQDVRISHVMEHFTQNYFTTDSFVILAGNFDSQSMQSILNALGNLKIKPKLSFNLTKKIIRQGYERKINGVHKQQSSVKMGLQVPTRNHPDFPSIYFMHILCGGYFHSRLNKNIRERQGLTYYIATALETSAQAGIFYITAETASKQVPKLLTQVSKELTRMIGQPLRGAEMTMIRNYIIGNMIQFYDETFAKAETLRQQLIEGAQWSSGYTLMKQISQMKAGDLNDKIKEYLLVEKMITIIAE